MLRAWREDDLATFAELNADPEVMRHFPTTLSRAQSDEFARSVQAAIASQGWGLWALEVRDEVPFIGFVGLNPTRFEAHFTPAIEVGWRLQRPYWGHGYATEAATATLTFAFDELSLPEVVSFTSAGNDRSRRVMERLGMSRDPGDDFDNPNVQDHLIRRHVLYRIRRERWPRATRVIASPREERRADHRAG